MNRPAEQPALPDTSVGGRRRIQCKNPRCPHELTDPESIRRGYGPICDPLNKPKHRDTGVDQDTLPGT
ncbi:hypothetical protein GCM10010361_77690 [Streptomyces olivaceiscleroticus]|uniref:Transposase n=1 Tax=Streptomyces olivaceiscleroticus TaxID=68245 RepID=A0ABP3LKC3_9ACTN